MDDSRSAVGKAATMRDWPETHQITVFLGAISLGIVVGTMAPNVVEPFEYAVTPVLAALIYTTFLQVPLADLRGRDAQPALSRRASGSQFHRRAPAGMATVPIVND